MAASYASANDASIITTMKHAILRHRELQVCAALIAADCLVFTMVNPVHASAVWLIIGYVLLGLTLLALAALLARGVKSYSERAHTVVQRFLRYGVMAVFILIGLQSVGQLTTKDVLTLLPFTVIAYLYFGYGRRQATELISNK